MSKRNTPRELLGSAQVSSLGEELAVYQAALVDVDKILRPLLEDARDRLLGGSALHGVETSVQSGRENQLLFSRFALAVLPRANSSLDGYGSIRTKDPFEAKVAWSRMLYDWKMPQFVIGAKLHKGEKRYTDLLLTTPVRTVSPSIRIQPIVSLYRCRTDDYERWCSLSDSRLVSDIPYETLRDMYQDETGEYVPQANAIRLWANGKNRLVLGGTERRENDLIRRGLIAAPSGFNSCDLGRRELSGINLVAFNVGRHLTGLAIDFNKTNELDGVFQAHIEGMLGTDET
jgi:hypothetical protein